MDLKGFLLTHGFLNEQEAAYLAEQYPGETLLAAAVSEGILSAVTGQDVERLIASRKLGGLEPRIPGMILLEVVGHGSKGSVYRAWQTALRRLVAVKVLSREFTGNKEELSRFVREARIAAKLNHPALVRAYDIGQTAEALYIVLEYVEGETLQQLLKRDQRLPVSRTCAIAAKVAEGLAFAAAQGVAHRDIKPANIQLSRHGGVKVLDLGLARPEGDSTLTQPLVVHGTPAYIAPEQARGERKLTPKVDVYALGVVIYRCLSGRHPFAAEQTSELLSKHIHQQAPQLDQVLKGVPEGLSRLVSSMLAKDPAKRPDASVVAVQLRQYVDDASLADIATTATMASRTGKTGAVPFQRFSPMVVLMAAGGLVAALLIVMLIVVSNNKSEQERLRQDLESEQQRASQAGKRAQAAAVQAKKYTETMEKLSDAAQSENPPPVSTGLAGDIERALDNNRALMDDKPE